MTGAGYAKGGDGIWAKGGTPVSLTIKTTAGNARRELTEQILQSQLKKAGFDLKTDNQEAGALFGEQLPAGQFQLALYAQVATFIVPGQCNLFCAKNIPTANNNTGQNWTRTNIPAAEAPLLAGGRGVEDSALSTAGKEPTSSSKVTVPIDPRRTSFGRRGVGPVSDSDLARHNSTNSASSSRREVALSRDGARPGCDHRSWAYRCSSSPPSALLARCADTAFLVFAMVARIRSDRQARTRRVTPRTSGVS
jgi:hypothetical protein